MKHKTSEHILKYESPKLKDDLALHFRDKNAEDEEEEEEEETCYLRKRKVNSEPPKVSLLFHPPPSIFSCFQKLRNYKRGQAHQKQKGPRGTQFRAQLTKFWPIYYSLNAMKITSRI